MPSQTRIVRPGPRDRTVTDSDGSVLEVPATWALLPPGDAGLTRRVKASGPTWTVQEKRGRKTFSRGVWADSKAIDTIRQELLAERGTEAYQKSRASSARRRNAAHQLYVEEFEAEILRFLAFAPEHAELAKRLAAAITAHATPVGSGTVARTKRIPVAERAEAAVIAWMRHQTTLYEHMKIPRVKGKRREVRRQLASESRRLLTKYRQGDSISDGSCPLLAALA